MATTKVGGGLSQSVFGKPVILDSKEPDTLRDDAGKVVARRSGPDKLVTSLAERAAF